MKKNFLFLIIFLITFISCQEKEKEYTIIYSAEEPFGEISKHLKEVLESELDVTIDLILGAGSIANVDSVAAGKADFAITENYVPENDSIRSVMSLFPQILHVIYDLEPEPKSFRELVENNRIFIGTPESGSYRFMIDLFEFFDLDRSKIDIAPNPFADVKVYAGFSDVLDDHKLLGIEHYKIYSFDEIEKFQRGSIADAVSLRIPKIHPYIIPEFTYAEMTPEPVLTLSTDAVLVTNHDVAEEEIYAIVKTIYAHKSAFTEISPLIAHGLNEDFDRGALTFGLHEGARMYLDRDEPGVIERYAELTGVLFSILVALISGIISLTRWRRQRKKDRVDVFYEDLIEIKNRMDARYSPKQAVADLKLVKASQNKAFKMLIDEDLAANESFRIYMELSKEVIDEIRHKLAVMKRKNSQKLINVN